MRQIFLVLMLVVVLTGNAANRMEVVGAVFGASYDEVLVALKSNYGEPTSKLSDKLIYLNKSIEGVVADRVELGFQKLNGTTKMNQVRFYFVCSTKAAAVAKMKELVKKMKTKYVVSYDEETEGTAFYTGGCSPLGIGNLFTIFVSPYKGKWSCQLRFGKFVYKN